MSFRRSKVSVESKRRPKIRAKQIAVRIQNLREQAK